MGGSADIAGLAQEGVAVIVATRDGELRPEVSRAWGPSLSDDGARLTVCVEATLDSAMARNLEPGSPLAAVLSRLSSQLAVQLKGRVVAVAELTEDRRRAVAEHVDRFVAETALVGVSEATARRLVGPDLLSVTVEISERFDATPGQDSGRPL